MAQQFDNQFFIQENLNYMNCNKSTLGPLMLEEINKPEDFLIDPFQTKKDNLEIYGIKQTNSLWGQQESIFHQRLGNMIQDIPVSKKFKISQNESFILTKEPIISSHVQSTQSDTTSSHESSGAFLQNLYSNSSVGQITQSSKLDESSLNTVSNFEQSHSYGESSLICKDQQNSIEEGLTKKKRGRKFNSKQQLLKNKQKNVCENEDTFTKEENRRLRIKKEKQRLLDEEEEEKLRLTNKKIEYLQEEILDKNGKFSYLEDPNEYKKARKRMQNRESAVRSRMRKRDYQDELEDRISYLEKLQKQINEQNAGLSAQNTLLKKQLAYFEDVFAKSSLLGFDNANQTQTGINNNNISRNELEEMQIRLLRKIDSKLFQTEMVIDQDQNSFNSQRNEDEGSLDIIPGRGVSSRFLDQNDENISMNQLRLVRQKSNSSFQGSSGYLFLAIVFCMMCCSSLFLGTSVQKNLGQNLIQLSLQQQSKQVSNGQTGFESARKLLSCNQQDDSQMQQNSLASPLEEENVYMKREDLKSKSVEFSTQNEGANSIVELMISGKYTYMTYMLLSTTCFFFWLTPNCYKFRNFFNYKQFNNKYTNIVQTNKAQSNILPQQRKMMTRSQTNQGMTLKQQ